MFILEKNIMETYRMIRRMALVVILTLVLSQIGFGQNWNAVPGTDNLRYGIFGGAECFAVYKDVLYVGGGIRTVGDVSTGCMAKFNGKTWSAVGSGLSVGVVRCLAVYKGELYAGGTFKAKEGNFKTKHIARWDGKSWKSVGEGFDDRMGFDDGVFCFAEYKGDLYVGGSFVGSGAVKSRNIIKWDGGNWSSVGTEMGHFQVVGCLMVYKDELYLGSGSETNIGGITSVTDGIMRKWDGSKWSNMDKGVDGFVDNFYIYQDELYVSGSFKKVGNLTVNKIASWNGTEWKSVGSGIESGGWVTCFGEYKGELFVGGTFKKIGGVETKYIAKWNGKSWSGVGVVDCSPSTSVSNFGVFMDELYVGGAFNKMGGVKAVDIVKWVVK